MRGGGQSYIRVSISSHAFSATHPLQIVWLPDSLSIHANCESKPAYILDNRLPHMSVSKRCSEKVLLGSRPVAEFTSPLLIISDGDVQKPQWGAVALLMAGTLVKLITPLHLAALIDRCL